MAVRGWVAALGAIVSIDASATCWVQVPNTCLPNATLLTGSQPTYDKPGKTRTTGGSQSCGTNRLGAPRVDAAKAEWAGTWDAPLSEPIRWGNPLYADLCWHGGDVRGGFAPAMPWSDTHGTRAIRVHSNGSTVEGVCVESIGDGVSVKWGLYLEDCPGASDDYWKQGPPASCETGAAPVTSFTVRGSYFRDIRDDAIEGDYLPGGLIEDVLIDGAFTAFGFRMQECDHGVDGRDRTLEIGHSLVRLQDTVWEPARGRFEHGQFFKWPTENVDCNPPLGDQDCNDPTTEDCTCPDKGLRLNIHDSHFRVDNHNSDAANALRMPTGSDGTTKLGSCSNNVVTWLGGGGPYTSCPAPAPQYPNSAVPCDLQHWNDGFKGCFVFRTDASTWNQDRRAWITSHGCTCGTPGCPDCEGLLAPKQVPRAIVD